MYYLLSVPLFPFFPSTFVLTEYLCDPIVSPLLAYYQLLYCVIFSRWFRIYNTHFFNVYLFWEREIACAHTHQQSRGRERRGKREYQWRHRAWHGAWSHKPNHEIMTWPKINSQMLNWLDHPGAPLTQTFKVLSL